MDRKKLLIIVGSILLISVTIILLLINKNNEEIITYNVSFETNGGTLIESQTVNLGEKVVKPNDPTREGYIFVEWQLNGSTYDFSLEVTSDLVLIAKWSKIESETEVYTVKFETDGGTTISNQVVEKGEKVVKPKNPVKNGYVFKEWRLNGELYDFDTVVENDIVLKAIWEKEINQSSSNKDNSKPSTPVVKKYTVIFNSNGGSAVSSQTIEEGKKAIKPQNPTRNGYTFVEWQLNGKTYDFNSKVNGNITLTAKWTENEKIEYTVTFNSNGGSAVSSQNVEEGKKVIKPQNPTRNGYTFVEWQLNGITYDFNSKVNENITLTAKWTQKTYTITATRVDAYSPDSILTVFENGNKITVQSIKYSDGTYLCSGSNTTVNTGDIAGETNFIVVLSDGTHVNATLN